MSSSASVDGETSVTACNSDEALSYIVPTSDDNRAATTPERSGGHQVGRGCNGSSVSDNMKTSSGPSFWPANADTVSTRTKPKKKRRRDRNRPIHEIHRQQTQVQGMERRLKALRPASSRATNELKALKDKLKKCLESTAAVDKLMQTQADELLQALPKSLAVTGRNLVYDVDEDDAVFQVLATTVDQHYVDLSRVFEAAGLRDAKSEIFDAYVNSPKSTTDSECVLKTRTCAFLPYARKLLEQAMWRRLECESAILPENIKSSRDLGPPMGSASNLIVSKREVHLDNASFTIRLAVKEYVEADRLVYVWDAIDVSVLKSYVLVTATVTPPVDVELVERAMHLYRRTIESRYQKLENTLVDTSICSRK
ncbi:hypothetical protein PF008_g3434 [Phytophthora fragariae]|uniref:Uncharacterized protein n=1 Tax=Phytophthora fragariae TaxID=53985 RepID=A0A6G0SG09_9STRA|nr:hypothetical protein PF008_g3434 [Phytophthora fragariae]